MSVRMATCAKIRIYSADIERALLRITQEGIILHQIRREDTLCAVVDVDFRNYRETLQLLERLHLQYDVLNKDIKEPAYRRIFGRSVLILGFLLIFSLTILLPGRILFIYVNGNRAIPTRMILEAAGECGIHFGAATDTVRSEQVKNALLEAVPELKWVGINTRGCVATISVLEDSALAGPSESAFAVSSIVAAKDSVVLSCVATKGSLLCKVGDTVTEGQILVSGYTDCGIVIKATQAEGEIIGQSIQKIDAIMPMIYSKRGNITGNTTNYALRIGKKLINLDNNSGIYTGTCAKIYEEYYLSLPGGFILPVCIVKETTTTYEAADTYSFATADERLESYCSSYLRSFMLAGMIESQSITTMTTEDALILNGEYICREVIGRQKPIDILQGEFRSD